MNEINTLIVYMIFIFFIWVNNSQSSESLVKRGGIKQTGDFDFKFIGKFI